MVQKVDPFVNLNWGWSDGENGWGAGMNENLITYSFFHNRRIQSIIANASLLPSSPTDGEAHFSTSDKTVYFRADGVWYFTVPPIGMEFILTTTNTTYKYDGNNLVVKTLDDFGVTPFGSSLLAAADAPAGRTVLGLGNVDNTSDLNKPISTATQNALDNKVSTVVGKQLSQEDYTTAEKAKLAGIATGATANSSDATLLARSNHTGTQAISTVSGLQTALDNKLDDSQLGAANGVAPLGADGKVPAANLPASGSYSGTWNASTNTPTITSSSGTNGQFYIVSVAGSTTIDGVSSWAEGDQIRFNGTVWQKIPNTNAVTSVAGKTGAVTLVPADAGVNIGVNVQAYDADLQAIAALAGTSGLLRKTATDTWSLDTSSYLTGNQTITLTGDLSGSGTTSIAATLPATGVTAGTYKSVTVDTKGRVTAGTNPTTLSGYGITDAAPIAHVGTGGTAHADATTSVSGFMSGADKTKLNGVATGATANSPDATLLARANHTGTQVSSTISDWTEAVQDVLGSTLVAGSNITLNYNDAANTLTINSTASGGSSTFLGLTDTPSAYTTHALKAVRVNSGETGLEFVTLGTAAFSNTGDFAGSSHGHDASAIITGTISDSRLPSTMSGKTFTSSITSSVDYGVQLICNVDGTSGGWARSFPVLRMSGGDIAGTGWLGTDTTPVSWSVGTGPSWWALDAKLSVIYSTGNVLIGTTTDSGYKLDVNGYTRIKEKLALLANDAAIDLMGTNNSIDNIGIYFRPYQADRTNPAQATITAKDYNYSADIIFKTKIGGAVTNALSERMRLTASGNLLIGTEVGSGYKLEVNGTTRLNGGVTTSTITSNAKILSIFNAGATPNYSSGHLELNNNGSNNPVTLGFHRSGSTACALVHDGGNNLRIDGTTYGDQAGSLLCNAASLIGNLTISKPAPVIVMTATTNPSTTMGNYISFRDNTSTEVAWLGFGTSDGEMGFNNSSRNIRFFSPVVLNSTITGNGSGLTSLNASNLSSGTVPVARLPTASTSSSGIVQLGDGSGAPSSSKAATEAYVYSGLAGLGSRISNESVTRATPSQLFQSLGTVSGSVTINGGSGTHVLATAAGGITWTFPSPSSTEALALTLELTNGGAHTMTWPAGIRWTGGVAPTLTASGTDILVFTKAGTNNWRGYLSSKDNK